MEPLSEAALGVLRDKTIGDYLHERFCGTTVFSKLDHGQQQLDHIQGRKQPFFGLRAAWRLNFGGPIPARR